MPDKLIYIKRSTPFVHDQINSEAMKEQLSMTKRSIGSYFPSKNSPTIGTGLTPAEQDLLMPIQLTMVKTHPDYHKTFKEFFININTDIPGGFKGRELNIGLEDNTKALSATNMPVALMDYIRWKHAIGYPNTAISPEAAKGNPTVEYYQEDPVRVAENNYKNVGLDDDALAEYLKAKEQPEQVNMLLSVLKGYIRKQSGRPPVSIARTTPEERVILLKEIVMSRPEKFYEAAKDPNLKKRYLIEELLGTGLLSRIGNSIVDVEDSNKPLGNTVVEVLTMLSNPKEAERLQRLKASYDEKKGNKVIA